MHRLGGCFGSTVDLCPRSFAFSAGQAPAVEPPTVNQRLGGRPNKVSSVRFPSPVVLTWLPKSLFAQFMRLANRYFLFVSCLVCFPFSPIAWTSTVMPFAAVLLWSALKDLYEDMRRRRDDTAENLRPCYRFHAANGSFKKICWQEVHVGDILMLQSDEAFPADLLILAAESGRAYISTANLDGETNLKEKRPPAICVLGLDPGTDFESVEAAPQGLASPFVRQHTMPTAIAGVAEAVAHLAHSKGMTVAVDEPKVGFDDMGGKVEIPGEALKDPSAGLLYAEHFAPRGCVLRNTGWMVAVAAYVGDESKSRLNVAVVAAKFSNLQVYLNNCVSGLIITLAIFCLYAACMSFAVGDSTSASDFFVCFFKYWIILYQIVPISLYVCFELVKLLLGLQIQIDRTMMDPDTKQFATARTVDLVEEMGQVQHIFSDKTGTITANEMRFARACLCDKDMGEFRPGVAGKAGDAVADPDGLGAARRHIQDASSPMHEETERFFLCLATCHAGQVEMKDGKSFYSSSSPDEVAFLDAARIVGVELKQQRLVTRDGGACVELMIAFPDGDRQCTILAQVPFNSDRKRMTVVCEIGNELMCITKGADSIMAPLCQDLTEPTLQQIDTYAKLGLRTLVIAWKIVTPDFFAKWRTEFETAKAAPAKEKEAQMATVAAKLENSLRLSGVSAIEDRLQDGVPEAMATLKAMGINIWMLTGDKVETAVEIARSCSLLSEGMNIVTCVNASSTIIAITMLQEALRMAQGLANVAFVLDGTSMKFCSDEEEGQELLFRLGSVSKVCICCRLAPQQKRRLIEIVRAHDKARITLAIGDGANDVPMIQGAHVGVGIRGKEGNQSVQAADIALSQFQFLVPLLACHGRRAYRRVATFLCYYVYKHVCLAVGDMCWAHQSRFRGQIAYPEWVSSCYAAFFTTIPIIVVLVCDRDIPDAAAILNPQLYSAGQRRAYFNGRIFSVWMVSAVWHGSVAWFVPSLVLEIGSPGSSGDWNKEWWVSSVISFSLTLTFVELRLWLVAMNKWSLWTFLGIMSSPVAYITTLAILGHTYLGNYMQPQLLGVPVAAVTSRKAMLTYFITPCVLLVDAVIFYTILYLRPSPLDEVRRGHDWVDLAKVHDTTTRTVKTSRVSPPPKHDTE